MRRTPLLLSASLIGACVLIGQKKIEAQASPTATQTLQLSAFGGFTGTATGLHGGRNASFTVGGDLGFLPVHRLYPSLEFRSTYVLDSGGIDGQKNVLGGLKVAGYFGRLHPYGDLLVGRGSINYGAGYQVPGTPIFYTQSHGNVISPGIGMDYEITNRLSLKFDAQYQRYATPVTTSGHLYSTSGTVGLVYRFDFNKH